uniref:Uncharacterized protein n=1 Tax=Glossina palpalis gambiensis TaxID=67801 RepID=A0A1B0B3V3_9MUSC
MQSALPINRSEAHHILNASSHMSIIVYNGNNCVKQTIEMDTNSRAEQAVNNVHDIYLRCTCKEIRKTFYRFMMWQLSHCPFVYKFVNKSLPNLIYLSMDFLMRHMRQFCAFLMSIVIAIDFVTASEQHDDEGR